MGGSQVRREILGARESEPTSVDAGQSSETHVVLTDPVLEEIVEVAKPPGDGAKSRDAKQRIENLRIDFDPDTPGRVDVVAGGPAHGGRGIAQEQEEHTAPSHDIQSINRNQKAHGRDEELPEGLEENRR